jgi:regulator of protease activity HflC (stomatin/prohibitin superfamily)
LLIILAVIVLGALKMARQWEQAVVLRAGKFLAVRGPGLFWIIPVLDTVAAMIDTRLLRKTIDGKTKEWGIVVKSVEIRDVTIPTALQDAMSREAQAERERQARVILSAAEAEIAHSFFRGGAELRRQPSRSTCVA